MGGGDAPTHTGEVRLLVGPVDAMRPGDSGIRRYFGTFLVVAVKGLIANQFPVFITATPSKWISLVVKDIIPPDFIEAVYGPLHMRTVQLAAQQCRRRTLRTVSRGTFKFAYQCWAGVALRDKISSRSAR